MGKNLLKNSSLLLSSVPSRPPISHPDKISSTSLTSITPRCSTRETGPLTRNLDPMITTAPSPSPTTGRVPNSALSPGNAEAPECAKEADGAPDSTDVKDLLSPLKPQVLPPPTERASGHRSDVHVLPLLFKWLVKDESVVKMKKA